MPKQDPIVPDSVKQLNRIQNKISAYFQHVQSIYDSIKTIDDNDPQSIESFLANSFTIDSIHLKYVESLEERCNYEVSLPESVGTPSYYNSLISFEQLYSKIKYTIRQLTKDSSEKCEKKQVSQKNVMLPKLELCSFDGNYDSWPIFYETFRTTIHENSDLTDSEKMRYLISKLSGQAQLICQGIIPSGDNYEVVWKALVGKYSDKRVQVTSYFDKILNLAPVDSSSPASLEEFIDKFSSITSALNQMKIESLHDLFFIHIACKRLNLETVKSFEMSIKDKNENEMPTCTEFVSFVRNHAHLLQRAHNLTNTKPGPQSRRNMDLNAMQSSVKITGSRSNSKPNYNNNVKSFINVQEHCKCVSCGKSDHIKLAHCPIFLSMSPHNRYAFVKRYKLCVNCLSDKHSLLDCKSTSRCNICSRSHFSLLHFNNDSRSAKPTVRSGDSSAIECVTNPTTDKPIAAAAVGERCNSDRPVTLCAVGIKCDAAAKPVNLRGVCAATSILLGTVQCHVVDDMGNTNIVRGIVDSASQRDFITTDCCRRLKLTIFPTASKYVSGVGDVTNPIDGVTCLTFSSRHNDKVAFTIQPLVINSITDKLPVAEIDTDQLDYLNNLPLADSRFNTPAPVDLILGADFFARILRPDTVARASGEPVAVNTQLGYIVIGQAPVIKPSSDVIRTFYTLDESINDRVSRFFELEEVPTMQSSLSSEEKECETFYSETMRRDDQGRYMVSLPFKRGASCLGDSLGSATRRYLSLERKILANPTLKKEYDNVFHEYLHKDYLRPVTDNNNFKPHYVIPHHAVIREDKSTTRLRVVLDASHPTTNRNLSLNDILHTGPNLQNDLCKILLRFRLLPIAISADIRQMYLRILMNKNDWKFQRLLYRFDPNDQIQVFELTRVAFGMCASPYLAVRTIRQLAIDESDRFPVAAQIATRDIYMDDLATSCMSVDDGIALSDQLIKLFASGGFDLVKLSSNSPDVMASIPVDHRVSDAVEFSPGDQLKILGLHWLPAEDVFAFSVNSSPRQCTKRNILSVIARLWDLLGFIAPVTLLAKLIVKSLWNEKVDWDETPPPAIIKLWQTFQSELPLLENIRIPRHVGVNDECEISILAFGDASEVAYGGMVYVHVYFPMLNHTIVNLVCAKSRVAPSKTVLTLARLELCANLISAKLARMVMDTYSLPSNSVYVFTDSKVALAWIRSMPSRWQTFVANRVSQIQESLDQKRFFHIAGKENPADCLSRGLTPAQLLVHPLWFNGPKFIYEPRSEWPLSHDDSVTGEIPEAKVKVMTTTESPRSSPVLYELASRVSSWNKLLRIVIYVLRFIKKLPLKFNLTHLEYAETVIIKTLQSVYFADEIIKVKLGKTLPPAFLKLNAFLDCEGILRVGGRLNNAPIEFDSQHPILLPRRDHIVNLIIDYYHQKHLHTGPQLLMSLLRQRYWIMSARNIVRNRVQKCNVCFRTRPVNQFPIMADLPACRVTEAKAFCHTGVDYAGPLSIILRRGRGMHSIKAYLCLFVCLVTKAVHLELSSDLSTEAFLNAFRRFLARRGPVSVLYSDRGTNFIGAKSYLDNMYQLLESEEYRDKFANELRDSRIEFRFNPACAPHFGGCWERNVLCVKQHLARVVGNQLLTYEEMLTVLTQIEALLNSRPLSVLSSDPAEPLALTPAHFLVMTPLKSLPSEDLSQQNVNLLLRKRAVDQIVQSFWKRWKLEYLNTLQVRSKWTKSNTSIQAGTVVLLESDNSAPLNWPIGVIERTFPGKDNVVRVVDVRTKTGVYRRPVVKIYPLPTQ